MVQEGNGKLRIEIRSFRFASWTPCQCRRSGTLVHWRCRATEPVARPRPSLGGERLVYASVGPIPSADLISARVDGLAEPSLSQVVPRALPELGRSSDATALVFLPSSASFVSRSELTGSRGRGDHGRDHHLFPTPALLVLLLVMVAAGRDYLVVAVHTAVVSLFCCARFMKYFQRHLYEMLMFNLHVSFLFLFLNS